MSELFNIPESKSPRLLWIEKHQIKIDRDFYDEIEDELWPFMAGSARYQGFGKTEDEALIAWARASGTTTWIDEKLK